MVSGKGFSREFRRALVLVLILGAAGWAALWYSTRDARAPLRDMTYIPRTPVITPEIRFLQSYVRIDTSNPPGNETAGARLLIDRLRDGGIEPELIESAPGRGNVYARLKGKSGSQGLMLLSHIDVVRADPASWSRPPFSAEIRANMIYGRGTLDMKSVTVCHLEAFLALARANIPLQQDVVFLATADEEEFGELGVPWLMSHRPDIFQGVRYAITEGGVTETVAEKVVYFGIETGSKQFVQARLTAPAKESVERARIALEPYFEPRDPDRVLPEVRDYLSKVAPARKQHRELLQDIDRTIAAGKFWLLDPGYRELLQNNVVASGALREGDSWYSRVALMNLPDEVPEARLEWLRAKVAPFGVTVRPVSSMGPAPISSDDTPMFRLIAREIRAEYGADIPVGPMILPKFATDCRHLRREGVQCYGMWPYPVNFYQTRGIHGVDESLRLDWFMKGVEMTRRLVEDYASDK